MKHKFVYYGTYTGRRKFLCLNCYLEDQNWRHYASSDDLGSSIDEQIVKLDEEER